MKKLRIMWLHSHLTLPSGGTKYVLQGIQELSKNHSVDLFVQKASPEYEQLFKKSGINITIMNTRSTGDLIFWLNFKKQIKNETLFLQNLVQNYDLVISSMFPMNVIASKLNLPHLQSCFQPFAFFWDPNMISKLPMWERFFLKIAKFKFGKLDLDATKKSDLISTVIPDVQQWISKIYERDSFVAYPGVDTNFFKKDNNFSLGNKYRGKKIILHSTDWTPLKRTNWLIDEFVKINSKIDNCILLIMEVKTTGTERSKAIKKIKGNLKSNIELCGFVPESLLPSYYSLADLTIYCGIGEGTGAASYIVLESLSCETPVIRTQYSNNEIEHGKTGYLFEKDDTDKFQKYVIDLLNDEKLRIQFGKEGRKFIVENRSWKKFAELYENHLIKITT